MSVTETTAVAEQTDASAGKKAEQNVLPDPDGPTRLTRSPA